MKKQEKKNDDPNEISDLVEELASNLIDDRSRLSGYLDRLLKAIGEDGDQVIVAADAIAKISDALTKQNHLHIDAMKVIIKSRAEKNDEGDDRIDDEIGPAFRENRVQEN